MKLGPRTTLLSIALVFFFFAYEPKVAHADPLTKLPSTITITFDPKEQARLIQIAGELQRITIAEMERLGGQQQQQQQTQQQQQQQQQGQQQVLSNGLVPLPVPGFGEAVVSVPLSSGRPQPVMIVTHGNHDSPESHCGSWRPVIKDRGFVLCIRGIRRTGMPAGDVSYTHGSEMPREIEAAVSALRERYGAQVDPGPMIYSGFSQGAGMGPSFIMKSPARYSRALMIEGGSGGWNETSFAKKGGSRVMFVTGQPAMFNSASQTAKRFERAKVPARVVNVPGGGHTYSGKVGEAIAAHFSWLVEGDPRWGTWPAPPPAPPAPPPPPPPIRRGGGSSV